MNRLIAISKRLIFDAVKAGKFYFRNSLTETVGASDEISLSVSKTQTETVGASDVVVLSVGKTVQDGAGASDALVKFVGAGRSDTIGASDSGVLLNQDYVDNALYFADDYVGIKRTF